jgi:ABC-2 type transport system ATP-binding protein
MSRRSGPRTVGTMSDRTDVPAGGLGTGPAIDVRGLAKSFKDVPVLRDVSFSVRQGSVFALLGANGSGKTTTINILTTLLEADSGSASVAGFDVASDAAEVRAHISVTGQSAAVDEILTARENLVMMGQLRHVEDPGRTADDLLDAFELGDAADRRLSTYSGGMRRKLDIAMSLVGRAPVVFFDEPTTGLDPRSRIDMWSTIRRLVEGGTTVFLTTQYLEEADELADDIAILHDGVVVAAGTPDELKARMPTGLVELEFREESELRAAERALRDRPHLTRRDATLTFATTGSVGEIADAFIALRDAGIEPSEFSRQVPSLDDVFLEVLDQGGEQHAPVH